MTAIKREEIIGDCRLLLGDNMSIMADMADNEFQLAIVDPPYGIGMSGGNVGYKGFNDLPRKDWDGEIPPDEYFESLKSRTVNQIIWGGNYFPLPPTRCFAIWDKGAGFKDRTYAECEMAWTSFDKCAKILQRDPLARGDYRGKIHPTQKPVALYRWLLKNYAKPGDHILDTHLGSGSSAIAAHYFGCDFMGLEIDEDYFNAAQKRFAHETRQISMFRPNPQQRQ